MSTVGHIDSQIFPELIQSNYGSRTTIVPFIIAWYAHVYGNVPAFAKVCVQL